MVLMHGFGRLRSIVTSARFEGLLKIWDEDSTARMQKLSPGGGGGQQPSSA